MGAQVEILRLDDAKMHVARPRYLENGVQKVDGGHGYEVASPVACVHHEHLGRAVYLDVRLALELVAGGGYDAEHIVTQHGVDVVNVVLAGDDTHQVVVALVEVDVVWAVVHNLREAEEGALHRDHGDLGGAGGRERAQRKEEGEKQLFHSR